MSDMKDLYIEAEEAYLNEITDVIESMKSVVHNIISIEDKEFASLYSMASTLSLLMGEADPLEDRVTSLIAHAADDAVDRAKDFEGEEK